MNNKEILAELKKCYEYLQDIKDNADNEQIDIEQRAEIEKIISKLADIYEDTFENKYTTNITIKEHNLIISNNIYNDYFDIESETFVTCGDIGYKWYNDYDFLTN